MDGLVFVDGVALEAYFETASGPMGIMAQIEVTGAHLFLSDTWFYPLTGSRLTLGVGEVLSIFRAICDQAREEGFSTCSAEGFRVSGARPGRMINLFRRL